VGQYGYIPLGRRLVYIGLELPSVLHEDHKGSFTLLDPSNKGVKPHYRSHLRSP